MESGAFLHVLGSFEGQLWSGAFSSDGQYLAISQGDPDCLVHVCEISTGRVLSSFQFHNRAFSLTWSPDGTMIACGADKGTLAVWGPYTGEKCMRWNLAFDDILMSFLGLAHGMRFLKDWKIIFQIYEGMIYVYDLETNRKQRFTWSTKEKPEKFTRAEMVC
jgi:WD40 repeat protein